MGSPDTGGETGLGYAHRRVLGLAIPNMTELCSTDDLAATPDLLLSVLLTISSVSDALGLDFGWQSLPDLSHGTGSLGT